MRKEAVLVKSVLLRAERVCVEALMNLSTKAGVGSKSDESDVAMR